MSVLVLHTPRLRLVLESSEEVLARIDALSPADRAEVSPDWLAQLRAMAAPSPWTHGFRLEERVTGAVVGSGGYKGPPADGAVEIAYGVEPDYRGRGYAKEAAAALAAFALEDDRTRLVRAHTRPENSASGRVLAACGFERIGEVLDPEDGLVWRWELRTADRLSMITHSHAAERGVRLPPPLVRGRVMMRMPPSARLAAHVLLAVLFALATFWALQEAREAVRAAGVGWRLALWVLAALGFVSLTARAVRAALGARPGRDGDTPAPPAT